MSWQKPSEKKCPQCGNYMVEKGNKLVCADEQCGYVMEKPESSEELHMESVYVGKQMYKMTEKVVIIKEV